MAKSFKYVDIYKRVPLPVRMPVKFQINIHLAKELAKKGRFLRPLFTPSFVSRSHIDAEF